MIPFRHGKLGPSSSVGYYGIQRSEEVLPDNLKSQFGHYSSSSRTGSSSKTNPASASFGFNEGSTSATCLTGSGKRTRSSTALDSDEETVHTSTTTGPNVRRHRHHRNTGGGTSHHSAPTDVSSPMSDISGTILSSSNIDSGSGGAKTLTDSDSEM